MVANNSNYEVSKNKHITDEDKNKQAHSQIKIHNQYLKNINKNWKITEHDEHKTDMNITKNEKYKKLKHGGTQNRHEHC